MKRSIWVGVAMCLGVGAIAVPASSEQAQDVVIDAQLDHERSSGGYIDAGKKSYSVGDVDLLKGPIFDTASGEKVGTIIVRCTWTKVNYKKRIHWSLCDGAAELADGDVLFAGAPTKFAGPGTVDAMWAVTGGTGAYSKARGTIHALETMQGVDLTFDLVTQ